MDEVVLDGGAGERVPVVVVADPGYVGQESVAEELGEGYAVTTVGGLDEALVAIRGARTPIVLLPENLEPLSGSEMLARLATQGIAWVGVLMADAPELPALARRAELPGVHAVAVRPLRAGALPLHLRAAAAQRRSLMAAAAGGEQANRGLDELLQALRHELRGQVQGVVGLAALLLEIEGERLSDEGRTWCRRMEAGGARLARLVDDLTRYLRLGRRPLELASLDVDGLAEEVFDEMRFARPDQSFDLAVEGESLRVRADRRALSEALGALVDNAVRFNASASPRVRIRVAAGDAGGLAAHPGGCTISVVDDGVGLPEGARARVLGLFERHHPVDERLKAGGGVGLALAAKVAERHGGRVWLEALAGGGTAARLYLPGTGR